MKHFGNDVSAPALGGQSGIWSGFHVDALTIKGHGVAPSGAIIVPDPSLLFQGEFKRSGVDLVLSDNGREFVLHNYFKGEKRESIASPDGAFLTGDVVSALAGNVEYAQAGLGDRIAQVIGHVTKLTGNATAIRNGVAIILNNGDNVEKGDVVSTGSESKLGITFIDGTVFGLSANSRMVLNEMVYDSQGSNNSSLLSLIAGTITFVAGETAKHGDMKVDTPVATMGIRGTAVVTEIRFVIPPASAANPQPQPQPEATFQVLVEPDGTTGSYILFDKVTLTPIATVNQAGQMIHISGGNVTVGDATLSPDLQKLIQDVFSLKFTGNSPTTKLATNFTDTITPVSDGLLMHTGGAVVIPTFAFTVTSEKSGVNQQGDLVVPLPFVKTVTVTPVTDKANFKIEDQVHIVDSNPSDVLNPYVPGSATILSVVGASFPPGFDLAKLISLNVATGAVVYDPAKFDFLGANQSVVINIGFDSRAGSDLFHEILSVTITGSNDGASITGTATGAVKEDGTLTASGTLTVSDSDLGETHFQAPASLAGTYGTFTFDPSTGAWGYTLNNAASNVQDLVGGQIVHDKLTVTSADGTASQQIDVTITGSNDGNSAPVLSTSGKTIESVKNLAANNGQVVSSDGHFFFGDTLLSFSDANHDPIGIMVTAVDNANGDWEYKLSGTDVWLKIPVTGALLLSAHDSVRFIGAANASTEQLTFKAWDGTDGHVAGDILIPAPTVFGGSTAYSQGTYVVGAKNNAPVGIAGNPINLGLDDPSQDLSYSATVTIKDLPSDWVLNGAERSVDGSWVVQTSDLDSITLTTSSQFSGAVILDVTASVIRADGTTINIHLGDNIEAYSANSPIIAWAGDDYVTASSGSDLIVFAKPIGADVVYSFDVAHDQIDLVGYAEFTNFSDIQSSLSEDEHGNAFLTLSDNQSILLQDVQPAALTVANFVFDQMPVLDNTAVLTISNGAFLPLTGSVHNAGLISLSSFGEETNLQLTGHGITLDGHGSVILSDSNFNVIAGTNSDVLLDNKDNTISGAGQLGDGELCLTNAGVIDATGTSSMIIDTGSNLIQNSGVLEASGIGGLTILSPVENSGVLWANGAKLTVQGAVSGNGTAIVDEGGVLDFEASSTTNVTFRSEAGGTLELGDAFNFKGTISGFDRSDVIELTNLDFAEAKISYQENEAGTAGMLTIATASQTVHLNLVGHYSTDNFRLIPDSMNTMSVIHMHSDLLA